MPRTTHTPGKFRVLVGNFDGATDPSQNGILGKPTRTMSGFDYQPLYFSGNSGNGFDLNGTAQVGNISAGTPSPATASFTVASASLTSTAYFFISTAAAGVFNLTFTGSPYFAAPVTLIGIAANALANTTAANIKAAIDGNPTLAALFTTIVQNDTPALGQARVAIVAKTTGAIYNSVNVTTTVPAGADYRILDATFTAGVTVTTRNLSGGSNETPQITIGNVTFEALAALTGIVGYPVLENTLANRQAIATALAAAISNIPQFSASTGGSDTVSILGPVGPDGGTYPYRIYQYGLALFSGITPSNNFFAVGVPTITGPTLT